jgi:hypothetical protein
MNTVTIRPSLSKVSLPEDPSRQRQLRKKMDEYLFRLRSPLYDRAETTYKIAVLERLFGEGAVDPATLAAELAADLAQQFDHALFYDAFAVIESYCRDGGDTAIGGTGLPKFG